VGSTKKLLKGSDFVIIFFLIQNLVKDSLPTEVTIVLTVHDLFVCKLVERADQVTIAATQYRTDKGLTGLAL